jgi:hypothetical protein
MIAFVSYETGKLFLPEDGTYVPKHVVEVNLMYALIRNFAHNPSRQATSTQDYSDVRAYTVT